MGSLLPGWGGPPAALHDEPTSSLMRALSLDSESERQLAASPTFVQRKTFAKMPLTSPRGAGLHTSPERARTSGAPSRPNRPPGATTLRPPHASQARGAWVVCVRTRMQEEVCVSLHGTTRVHHPAFTKRMGC